MWSECFPCGHFIDHDLIDQLVQHGGSQVLKVLILVDQCHELLRFPGAVGITYDKFGKLADFLFKSHTFALILVTEHLIPLVRQFTEDTVLIDLAEKRFLFLCLVLTLSKPLFLSLHVLCLLTGKRFFHGPDELAVIYLNIIMDCLQSAAHSLKQVVAVDPVARLALL